MEVCSSTKILHRGSGCGLSYKKAGQIVEHSGKTGANAQSLNRPAHCGSITFKGGFISMAKAEGLATALAKSDGFKSALEFVDKKEAMFSAFVSLGLLTTLKPMLTLIMPAAEGKDKVSVASKEIVGGLVGFGLANLVTRPLEVGIIKIADNPVKYVTNNEKLLAKLGDQGFSKTFATIYKNSPELLNACLKGTLTVMFMPAVIAIIDKLRNKKAPPKPIKQEDLYISEKLGHKDVSDTNAKGVK